MTCQDVAAALHPYLDDELSVLEVLRVQGHLHTCSHCRAMMGAEAALHALLEADAIQDEPPPALRDRIVQRISTAAASSPVSARRRGGVSATAARTAITLVGLLTLALMVPGIRGPVELPRFAIDAAAQHYLLSQGAEGGLDLTTTDLPQLTAWLRGRVGFSVRAPHVNRPDRHVVGGGVTSVGSAPAAYLVYEWGGHGLSLFVMPSPSSRPEWPERVIDGVEFYTATLHGTTIAWWDDAERLYIAASAAGPTALEEFARLCIRNGGRGGPVLLPPGSRDG